MSYALNDNPKGVSEQTRQRILRVARQMGYRHHRGARQLRAGATFTIGFQLDSALLTRPRRRGTATLTLLVYQGAAHHARTRGYHVAMLMPPDGDDLAEARRQTLDEHALDGLIMCGFVKPSLDEVKSFCRGLKGIPLHAVSIDRRMIPMGVPYIGVDRRQAIHEASERIMSLGHRSAAYFGLHHATHNEIEPRLTTFREALTACGICLDQHDCFDIDKEVDAYRASLEVMRRPAEQRPTCLIFAGDHLAMAALEAAKDADLKVPRDLSLLSMNNDPQAREADLPLSTIDHRYFDTGVMLAKHLIDRLSAPDSPQPESTMLAARFLDSDSLGSAPCFDRTGRGRAKDDLTHQFEPIV